MLMPRQYYVTGKAQHFSEQQLMDCSWDYDGNSACDGGEYNGALDYLIDAGGALTDQEYEYLGQDGWCTDRNHSDIHTSNLTRVKVSFQHSQWDSLAGLDLKLVSLLLLQAVFGPKASLSLLPLLSAHSTFAAAIF